MNTDHINRREFVALGVATATTTAVSSTALASSALPSTARKADRSLRIPAPSVAKLQKLTDQPNLARLSRSPTLPSIAQHALEIPSLKIEPLECVSSRLAKNSSITIEVHYPSPDLYSILYSAHNHDLGAFPAAAQIDAPRNTRGQTILRITQQAGDATNANLITLNTSNPGDYILAIPTAGHSSNAGWRFTKAHLDDNGQITALTNPIPAASSRCTYFSITINEQSTGA